MSQFHSCIKKEEVKKILERGRPKIFFSGICGAGMSPLARLLSETGGAYIVGSDRNCKSCAAEALGAVGIKVYSVGEYVPRGFDALVFSLAMDENTPEILYAESNGIPVMSRAQLMGALMLNYKHGIGVSGSHGKSTTTAMLSRIFTYAGLEPTAICGAPLNEEGNLLRGRTDYFIYEGCEYKDSFLYMTPQVQIVTSIELDHTDYFPDLASLSGSFLAAMSSADVAIGCIDDINVSKLLPALKNRVLTYGKSEKADFSYKITDMNANGTAFRVGNTDYFISAIGEHNAANALAAIAAATYYGIDEGVQREALRGFCGIERRLEHLFDIDGRPVYYDYAHHPTEISCAIRAIKELHGTCTVIFKPHTYSRTRSLWKGFVSSLGMADYVILLDIYPAREAAIPGITSEHLAEAVGSKCVHLHHTRVKEYLLSYTNGAVILMGAGDVDDVKHCLCEAASEHNSQ